MRRILPWLARNRGLIVFMLGMALFRGAARVSGACTGRCYGDAADRTGVADHARPAVDRLSFAVRLDMPERDDFVACQVLIEQFRQWSFSMQPSITGANDYPLAIPFEGGR